MTIARTLGVATILAAAITPAVQADEQAAIDGCIDQLRTVRP